MAAPIISPSISVLDGVGVPVAGGNRTGFSVQFNNVSPIVILGAAAKIFGNATAPINTLLDGVGVPVADGNQPNFPVNFDNTGKNASLGAPNTISDNATSPKTEKIGDSGIPVGTGNQPDFSVTFDNDGKNVTEFSQAGPPTGSILWKEVTFVTGTVLNVGG